MLLVCPVCVMAINYPTYHGIATTSSVHSRSYGTGMTTTSMMNSTSHYIHTTSSSTVQSSGVSSVSVMGTIASSIRGGVTSSQTYAGISNSGVKRAKTNTPVPDECSHCVYGDDDYCIYCGCYMYDGCECDDCRCPIGDGWSVLVAMLLMAGVYAICVYRKKNSRA